MARAIEGTIRITPNGRYNVRLLGKNVGTYDTWEEAERARTTAVIFQERQPLLDEPASGNSLKALRPAFFAWRVEREIADVTTEQNRWDRHLSDAPFYGWDVRRITIDDVDDHMLKLANKKTKAGTKLSRSSQKQVKQLLIHALDRYRKILNGVNVARGYKVPKERRTKESWDYLRREEIPRLLKALEEPARWFVQFAIGTGLRIGEQYCLHLKDVDVTSASPHVWVRHSGLKKSKVGKHKLKPPKNGQPRRVPLFGMGLEAARGMLAALSAYCPKSTNKSELLFPRPGGTYYDHNSYIPEWEIAHSNTKRRKAAGERVNATRPALRKAKIDRPIRWHDLRHTFATSLINGYFGGHKWSLSEVAAICGHSSIQMVQRYAHPDQVSIEETANLVDPNRGISPSASTARPSKRSRSR